jgi:hypothetical protein
MGKSMTPAEYKSACEATGRTLQEIADILGVALSTLYRRFDDYGRTGRPTIITGEMERAIRSIAKARKNNSAERLALAPSPLNTKNYANRKPIIEARRLTPTGGW